jgi:SAM-dependent methyltransferase
MDKQEAQKLLDLVKRNYQAIAADFDATRKKEIWPKMRELAGSVENGASVLDVGCGNGRLLEAFSGKNIKYLGLDNSEALIDLAKSNYPDKEFRVLDILNLESAPENNFNYIFCLAVLQHIPGRELRLKSLEQMKEKLAPQGKIIISVWNLWKNKKYRPLLFKNYWLKITGRNKLGYNDLLFPWKNSAGQETSERYYHAFTKKELKKLARLAGLKIRQGERDEYNFWYVLEK